jgi:RNA polymerase sigma factor (sigma-70 family)
MDDRDVDARMADRDADARMDAALVERAVCDADPRVYELLVRRHQGLVRAQLRKLLGDDPATADDLAQKTFVLAWRKSAQFRRESRFATWLYRIAYSCFLQFIRSKTGLAQSELSFDHESTDVESNDLGLGLDLAAALARLSINQRVALVYCVQMGLSHEEAAEVLNMPLGSVKTNVLRGKTRLRELLQDWAPNHQQDKSDD